MDQYSAINSKKFRNYLKSKKIRFLFTAVDCAASNGHVERVNQTLTNRLRCKLNDGNERRGWWTLIKECNRDYNQTIHLVTGYPPAYLLKGEEVELCPVKTRANDLGEDRRIAYDRMMKNHPENKRRSDRKRYETTLAVGDRVYVEARSKTNRNKLRPVRTGPFRILEQISPLMYKLGRPRNRNYVNIFHSSQLSRYP